MSGWQLFGIGVLSFVVFLVLEFALLGGLYLFGVISR